MKPRSKTKTSQSKAPKRRRFVAGLISGKSMRKAALEAGYTQSMADNAGLKILPGAREEFKQALAAKIPNAVLIRRIVEGLNARAVKLAQWEGKYTDKRYLVHYSERRRYVELAAKLLGFLVEKVELGGTEGPPPNFDLRVNFVDPDGTKAAELNSKLRQIYGLSGADSGESANDPESGADDES